MDFAHLFLKDFALVLCVAAVTTVASQALRLPVVLGYLVAGVIVGPNTGVPLLAGTETVGALSELGVTLLMFSIGLEFNFRTLARLAPTAGVIAAVEIGLSFALGFQAASLFGFGTFPALLTGAIVSISSTMIVSRAFTELRTPHKLRELVFGVLIMEDLAALILLASLTALAAGAGDVAWGEVGRTSGRLLVFLFGTVAIGLLVVPPLFRFIVRLRRKETLLVAAVGLCFALALVAQWRGYSVALGAFLAGMLLSEAGVTKHVEPLIEPLRDMFTGIFFVSVGMLLDPAGVLREWPLVLTLVGCVFFAKTLGVSVGSFLTGRSIRTSVQAGMSLTQIGEFSFVIATAGRAAGGAAERLFDVAVAVSVVTTFFTPWMIRFSERVALTIDARLPRPLQTFATLYGSWIELLGQKRAESPWAGIRRVGGLLLLDAALLAAVVISVARLRVELGAWVAAATGLGAAGSRRLVLLAGAAFTLPFVFGIVRLAGRLGQRLSERALPRPAKGKVDNALSPRRALTAAIQLGIVLVTGLLVVAVTQPFLPRLGGPAAVLAIVLVLGIAFYKAAKDLQGHVRAGAEVASHALTSEHRRVDGTELALWRVEQLLPGIGTLSPVRLEPGTVADGQTLKSVNLRGLTGATVVAIVRDGQEILAPSGAATLQAGDLLALSGSHEAVEAAQELLAAKAAATA